MSINGLDQLSHGELLMLEQQECAFLGLEWVG